MSDLKLVPCPFCGWAKPELVLTSFDYSDGSQQVTEDPFVRCMECGTIGPPGTDGDDSLAVKLWNRRWEDRSCPGCGAPGVGPERHYSDRNMGYTGCPDSPAAERIVRVLVKCTKGNLWVCRWEGDEDPPQWTCGRCLQGTVKPEFGAACSFSCGSVVTSLTTAQEKARLP